MSKKIRLDSGEVAYIVSQCKSCGELDCIGSNGDCGYCRECYAVEDYEYVVEDGDGNILGTERELL